MKAVASGGFNGRPTVARPGTFQKGNPGGKGRPKPQYDIIGMAKKASPEIMQSLIALALDTSIKAETRIRAGEVVLNRAYGMPRQAVDVKNEGMPMFVALLPPTAANADAWAAKAAQLNGGPKLIEGEFEPAEVVPLPVSEDGSHDGS